MSTLDFLNDYWIENSTYGLSEAPMGIMREPGERPKHFDKMGDAERAAADEGHEEGSEEFMEAVEQLRGAIKKKNADRNIEKGIRGKKFWDDPHAIAAAKVKQKYQLEDEDRGPMGLAPPWGKGQWAKGSPLSDERDRIADAVKRKQDMGKPGKKSRAKTKTSRKQGAKARRKRATQKMLYKDFSPALERLLAFGAGWALSGDVAGKDVPPEMIREWERAIQRQATEADKREIARQMRRRMRKSEDESFELLNDFFIEKDHAPVPPRVGLMWDAVKHRWTRPERIGRTVWELSGKKRIRGTGTGSHERSVKTGTAGGRGAGSTVAGRRFRGVGDAPGPSKRHPKSIAAKGDQKHPAFRRLKAFRRGRKKQYGTKKKK